jgi:hypothetical protein
VHTPKGVLYVVVLNGRDEDGKKDELESEIKQGFTNLGVECSAAAANEQGSKTITINKAHSMCGHMGQVEARRFLTITGKRYLKVGSINVSTAEEPRPSNCQ